MLSLKKGFKLCSSRNCIRIASQDIGFCDIKIPVCKKHYNDLKLNVDSEKINKSDKV